MGISPSSPRGFTFNWNYPDAAGISAMKARLKHLLRNPQYQFAHGNQLRTLFRNSRSGR